jgi:inosine-uridine nucleoside N-ribohydrolase
VFPACRATVPNDTLGVDDVLAMLLALAAKPEEIEVLLLSVTYGNVEVQRYVLSTTIHTLLTSAELFAECGSSIPCH